MTLFFAMRTILSISGESRYNARRRQQAGLLIPARPADPQHRPVVDAHAPYLLRGDAARRVKRAQVEHRVARYEFFAVSSAWVDCVPSAAFTGVPISPIHCISSPPSRSISRTSNSLGTVS